MVGVGGRARRNSYVAHCRARNSSTASRRANAESPLVSGGGTATSACCGPEYTHKLKVIPRGRWNGN
jgi:hypothetical protein